MTDRTQPLPPDPMTAVTPFDDDPNDTDYTWAKVRERLGVQSNTVNARWLPKLEPLFEGLKAPALTTPKGSPTKFGAQMIARYKAACVDGSTSFEEFAAAARAAFPSVEEQAPVMPEVLSVTDAAPAVIGDKSAVTDDKPAGPLALIQQSLAQGTDNIEALIVVAIKGQREANTANAKYQEVSEAEWAQQIAVDELNKINAENARKKKEAQIRAAMRQAVQNAAEEDGSPSP